jgi:GNAT superfamily N-acetyltransferase
MESHNISKVELRNLQMEDYDQLARSFKRIYGDEDVFWTKAQIKKLITIFPEGQVVIIVDDKIVGCALSIIVDYNMVKGDHTYAQVTGNETFNTHNAKGNILYGIEVFIHPDYRGLRLARRMYEYRKELCEKLNLKAIMFGGRIPNYHKYADKMRPKEYIERVRSREIYDPVLTFQLSNDFHVLALCYHIGQVEIGVGSAHEVGVVVVDEVLAHALSHTSQHTDNELSTLLLFGMQRLKSSIYLVLDILSY